jgi:hypothetical protein
MTAALGVCSAVLWLATISAFTKSKKATRRLSIALYTVIQNLLNGMF